MNEATFMVVIPLLAGQMFADDGGLLGQLEALRVEITFIPQTENPNPRTLNKFRAWQRFDYERFDYLFWLDADIFVAADPFPIIRASLLSESDVVMCVPEIYGYMRRLSD